MSILPIQSQGSNSSSSFDSISQNPSSSNHGSNSSISSSLSHQFHSLQFSHSSALSASAADDSAGSSRKVSELRTSNGKKILSHQDGESNGQGAEYAQSRGKMSETKTSPRGQQTNGPTNSQGGSSHSTGRKAQMVNANHLLNFQYDPIARSQPRASPPLRRQQKIKPYNKDLFLQANYKFVLLDRGDYAPEMMDPDKMLSWEDIICVRYATPVPVQCPICLEYPLCPQITTCGHIFCFPCILRYLLMGKEDFKGECFRRCPLCFVMVSQKDLHTIYIENVKQYSVGDTVKFMLLTRQKDSFTPFQRSNPEIGLGSFNENTYDPFAKFIFTSDVELSVRNAISELDSWSAKADSGLVDDLEKLPYVCAAMEKLEQRKKYWNEQLSDSDRNHKSPDSQKQSQEFPSAVNVTFPEDGHSDFICLTPSIDHNDEKKQLESIKLDNAAFVEDQGTTSSSLHPESKSFQKINDAYNFYQAVDGQHLILHPLNMKCLLHHYGSYDMLPQGISGKILQLELVTQSEAMRRRYRYLSHFSLTTTFQLCEIDLSEVLHPDSLLPFMDEIKKREKQRKELAKREQKEKLKAEAEAAAAASDPVSISTGTGHSSYAGAPKFSMDDFEALRSSTAMSSSPPMASSPPVVGERVLFSNVTRLGFAAGHDSPTLKIDEACGPHSNKVTNVSTGVSGTRNPGTPTFANVTSRAKAEENLNAPKTNDAGKKGKKPNRVLLSTAGGRRY